MAEKKITILGREVRMMYCAATENAFEEIAQKSIFEFNAKSQKDLLTMVVSTILTAYLSTDEQPPVSDSDLLYKCSSAELLEAVKTMIELRNQWYEVPLPVAEELKAEAGEDAPSEKN